MHPDGNGLGFSLSVRTERDHVIASLTGELGIESAPLLRDELIALLRPATSRLVIDLSAVTYADASGLAVLVGTGRRARLLGGYLRLAAPGLPVAKVMRGTGLDRQLDIFLTVQAAITGPLRYRPPAEAATSMASPVHGPAERARATSARTGPAAAAQAGLVPASDTRPWQSADPGELRRAAAAVLSHADAWRDADPRGKFTSALQSLGHAYTSTSDARLVNAAQSLLLTLGRQPLTYSTAVAATASDLSRLLDPDRWPLRG